MKIKSNFYKENGIFVLPVIAIGYHTKEHSFVIVFIFICWGFSIEFDFK